jgi:hypothetical protein
MTDRERKAVDACKAVLEAFQDYALRGCFEAGHAEPKCGYVTAEAVQERLVKQLTEAVGEPSKGDDDGSVRR